MNKYQEALEKIEVNVTSIITTFAKHLIGKKIEEIETMRELVDKATPMKVDMTTDTLTCPYCETGRVYDWENDKAFRFCADCGQAIDWSTDE